MLKASALLAAALPLAACGGDAPPPSEVRSRITEDLGNVLHHGTAAAEKSADALHASTALGLLDHFTSASQTVSLKRTWTVAASVLDRKLTTTSTVGASTTEFDDLIAELDTKIFTDANYQGDGIYKIPGSLACTEDLDGVSTVDADCVQAFDKLQLRLRVGEDDGALTIALQVDANHDEPLRFTLTHTSLAATVDLDEASQAMAQLAPMLGDGESAPNYKLAGQVTGKVEILGEQNAKFSFAIDRKVDVRFADSGISLDSVDAFRFASAAANVASLAFDGVAGTGSLAVDVGATTAHIPDDLEAPLDLDLPGASITATLATGQPAQLTHIALGDRTTTLSVGGQQAISLDLNPDDGRALSATISGDTITVSPKLDFRASIDHAVLGDTQPIYDVTHVLVTGGLRGVDDRIEVVGGTFAITTNPAQFGFSATAGQCVSATEVSDATSGELYEQWSVGACN